MEGLILQDIKAAFLRSDHFDQDDLTAAEQKSPLYQNAFQSSSNGVIICDVKTGKIVEANPPADLLLGYDYSEMIDLSPRNFIDVNSLEAWSRCVKTVHDGGIFNGNLVYLRRDGSKIVIDQSAAEIFYHNSPCMVIILRDLSKLIERNEVEKQLQQSVKVRTRELSTLLDISQVLSSSLDIDPELILDQLCKIVDYTQACLFTVDGSTLVVLAVSGPGHLDQVIPLQIAMDGPEILKILFNGHQTTRIGEICSSEPTAIFLRSLMKNQASVLIEGIHSWMWVPLAVKDRVLGGLGIGHAEPHYFTQHHADLAQTAANQAAITMANAELYEHARMFAVLQERQRLARNLHDAVNQSLFSASLIAEVLPRLWDQNQEEGKQSLEDLRRLTNGAMAEMRMMMSELRPMALSDAQINDLICLLADAFTGRTNIPVDIHISGRFFFPPEVQLVFYRLCQEALNNIGRHAQAAQVKISMHYEGDWVDLVIWDDGIGFDPAHTPPGHYGLSIMKERAQSIGAILTVESHLSGGTTIDLRWFENRNGKNDVK